MSTLRALAPIALVTAALGVSACGSDDSSSTSTTTAAPAASAPATTSTGSSTAAAATPAPANIPLLTADKVTKITVKKGDTVTFAAKSDTADEIHVHAYDLKKDVGAGQTVEMSFKATIEGIFEIEFENAGKQIAELRVNP